MAGITSIGAYVPRYRLSCEEIAKFWNQKSARAEKAVAGYDEDSLTMAAAAVLDCLSRSQEEADGLYFATTTAPYREKQGAALIAAAADLPRKSRTADFANSLRAGSIALKSALDAVGSGFAKNILVASSDCRMGATQGKLEQLLGDGAAAFMVGADRPIAVVEDSCSIFSDFTDFWRTQNNDFVQSAEARFVYGEGYVPAVQEAVSGLLRQSCAVPRDFSKIVFTALDEREHADLGKRLGFEKNQIQDPLYGQIGNTGTAAPFLMLVAALEEAAAGDRILYASYGDGCDALILRVTEDIARIRTKPALKPLLAQKTAVDYGRYLNWRSLVAVETSSLPQRSEPSVITRWRERKSVSALYGVRCKNCGAPQLHPIGQTIRVCATCQSKDNFDAYKFSDKKGTLFSYAIDQLQPTKNPPGLNGVVDFEGGGRLICELTDYELDKVRIGMPVEMAFRKMYQGQGIINYFWKAKPVK